MTKEFDVGKWVNCDMCRIARVCLAVVTSRKIVSLSCLPGLLLKDFCMIEAFCACVISWHKFFYAFFIEGCRLCLQPVGNIFFQLFVIVEVFTGKERLEICQVIYSQFGLAIHQNDHQARRRFVEWAQNEIAVVPDFHKRILFSDEAHFWLNGYVNKQNCRIWSEANPQVYVETPLHPEKLTVWCALWAGGILLPKR
ncbi:hypothetical protein TNCV_5092771 [Trichonephila clavipes]|nr:hypothetical protein TNCV_5092771 [Trichonephila clavipes]